MAERKPLTLVDGVITSLPAGDTITGAGATKKTTIDFGTTASAGMLFTIADAAVSPTSKIIAQVEYDSDEVEMTPLTLFCRPLTGTFTIYATPLQGSAHGIFKVNYTIG